MYSKISINTLIQKSLDGLYKSSMLDEKILVVDETPLFGGGSNIDSMCFVALMTEVEDGLSESTGKDIFLVLTDLEELYPNSPVLTVGMLANYLYILAND
jgi:hypothetical protein